MKFGKLVFQCLKVIRYKHMECISKEGLQIGDSLIDYFSFLLLSIIDLLDSVAADNGSDTV